MGIEMKQRLHMVIMDTSYSWLRAIEENLILEFSDMVSIQVITDPGYRETFFHTPRVIDLLVTDEASYGSYLGEHAVSRIILMQAGEADADGTASGEQDSMSGSAPQAAAAGNLTVLKTSCPPEELLDQIRTVLNAAEERSIPGEQPKTTKTVVIYSPLGGSGKSLVAYALGRKLKKLDQKVLLICCDSMQSLSVYYPTERTCGETLADNLRNPGEDTYWTILQNIEQEEISYLLPFEKAPHTLGIGAKEYRTLVGILKEKKDFDFLILDIGTELDAESAELMALADEMVLITEPNELASGKMQRLQKNAELLPGCEYILIANEIRSDGLRLSRDSLFGTIAPYQDWEEALEDPVFYRIALKLIE